MEQTREKVFDRIVLGLLVMGLIGSAAALPLSGVWSIWFWGAVVLLVAALVAYAVRSFHQFVVAAYLLLAMLVGLVAGLFRQSLPASNFIPYLFIPIVIIAGAVLPPLAPIITALISVCLALGVLLLTHQFTLARLAPLLPPLGLTVLVALLMAESGRQAGKLSRQLKESNLLLRERSWETLEALNEAKALKQRAVELEQQLQQAQSGAGRGAQTNGLVDLMDGAVRELNSSIRALSRVIEKLVTFPGVTQAGLLEEIWQKIDHLTNLMVNLEEMARLESGQVALETRPVNVTQLIQEVLGVARGLARAKQLELRADIPADLPRLNVDPDRLRQALLQILSNAVTYTDEGLVEVCAQVSPRDLIIRVSDTGPGIDRAETELVFQKFGRSSNPDVKSHQGPGLGLALSERLINLHGGRVWLNSVPGQGSTFYLSLPLGLVQNGVPARPGSSTLAATGSTPAQAVMVMPAPDAEPTLISRQPASTTLAASRNLGPVARFGPTYIVRFGLTLLALLALVAGGLSALTLVSRGIISEWRDAPPPSTPAGVSQPSPQLQAGLNPTATPTPRPSFTPVPSPTPAPTDTPPPMPTATPTAASTSTATATPTPSAALPGSPTPTLTATPSPSPTPEAESTPPGLMISFTPTARPPRLAFAGAVGLNSNGGATQPLLDGGQSWSSAGQLLFTAATHGDRDLYLARGDGSQPQRLTVAAGDDTQPAWSPDGRFIAFSSGRTGNFDIYKMPADGSQVVQLTTSRGYDEWPAWSPDGRQIVFVSDRDGNEEIYVMNADGSSQQRLTHHPAADWPASWSPAGDRLVFASNRDGNWNLYLINADGRGLTRLTADPADEREPAWSPAGRSIAFASDRRGNWDIYTLPVPGGSMTEVSAAEWTQITNTPTDERFPTWQP
ncbi:MAG: ATP-binding protein [Chloroflexota bacterium]